MYSHLSSNVSAKIITRNASSNTSLTSQIIPPPLTSLRHPSSLVVCCADDEMFGDEMKKLKEAKATAHKNLVDEQKMREELAAGGSTPEEIEEQVQAAARLRGVQE